jgi:hypothetical protein
MRSTNILEVITDIFLKQNILIHPNDGFDLGLMNTEYTVKVYANVTIEVFNQDDSVSTPGNLLLSNKCKFGTIKLCPKYWKKIGMPKNVKLFFSDNKVLISKM